MTSSPNPSRLTPAKSRWRGRKQTNSGKGVLEEALRVDCSNAIGQYELTDKGTQRPDTMTGDSERSSSLYPLSSLARALGSEVPLGSLAAALDSGKTHRGDSGRGVSLYTSPSEVLFRRPSASLSWDDDEGRGHKVSH